MFTLEQLRCFIAVAEHLHFGRAAEELSMTQPPLSRQIQKLEKLVGAKLLDRDNRGVELTAAGRAFLREARLVLSTADNASQRARLAASGMSGKLNIGFTAAAGFSLLGSVLALVERDMPKVSLDLFEMVTSAQIEALEGGHLDVGIGRMGSQLDGFVSTVIHREDLVLAAPEGHELLQTEEPLVVSRIQGTPLLLHSPIKARYLYDLVVRNFEIDHHQVVHHLSQITTMIALVASGQGSALVPASARKLGYPGVGFRNFEDLPGGLVQMHMIHSLETQNPAVDKLVDLVEDRWPAR